MILTVKVIFDRKNVERTIKLELKTFLDIATLSAKLSPIFILLH
jgi:hypothetical protein